MVRKLYPVLHIDDDEAMTALVAQLLRTQGISSAQLNDPTQAMAAIRDCNFRVVILDLDMPRLHGLDLLKQIKQFDGGINVIVLTGLVSQSAVVRSLRGGASTCIFKPLRNPKILLESVHLAFDNIDRWWNTLRELAMLHRDEARLTHMSDDAWSDVIAQETDLELADLL